MTVSRLLARAGQVVRGDRRPGEVSRAGLRPQRQVSVLLRLDRRRPGAGLVRAVRAADMRATRTSTSPCCARTCRRRSRRRATKRRREEIEGREGRRRRTRQERRRVEGTTQASGSPAAAHGGGATADAQRRAERRRSASTSTDIAVPHPRPADPGRRPLAPAGRQRRADLLPPRRSTSKPSLQRFDLEDAQGRDACCRRSTDYRRLRRRQEDSLPREGHLVHRADDEGGRSPATARSRPTSIEVQGRSARRVDADLQRSVAHQSRLLLRPEHARRGLEGGADEVRRVPARRGDHARDLQPRDPVDVQRAVASATTAAAAATRSPTPTTVPGGLLGADYDVENGRYRFKKVYGGLNWTPSCARRSPSPA